MSTLDEAFIKAYGRQTTAPSGIDGRGPVEPAPPTPETDGDGREEAPGAETSVRTFVRLDPVHVTRSDHQPADIQADAFGERFRPGLQVDRFHWPNVCRRLSRGAAEEVDRLADRLEAAAARGHRVVAFGGCRRGEGATTLLVCAARRLARRGRNLIAVDADLADPQLARRLGLLPESGWEEVLARRLPLEEVVIESVEDRLAVLPVCAACAGTGVPAADEKCPAESLQCLAAAYDLVLVDLGPLEETDAVGGPLARGIASRLDAIVLVRNARDTSRDRLAEVQRCLAATEIAQLGVVENFAPL